MSRSVSAVSRALRVPGRPPAQPVTTPFTPPSHGADGLAAHARYGHRLSQIAVSQTPIQRLEDEEGGLQLKAEGVPAARPDVPVAAGGGSPMPAPVRGKMEWSFGHHFADVRIHSGEEAGQVGALAYTRGTDIHFQPGLYSPDSLGGQELLGHELTHVVQQRAGRVSSPQQKPGGAAPINADANLEAEADTMGARAAHGQAAHVSGAAGGGLQRKTDVVQCKPGFFSKLVGRSEDELEASTMTDADVEEHKMQKGETSGRVDRMAYDKPIGASREKKGFFKPEWQPGNALPAVMGNTVLDPNNLEEHQPEAIQNGLRLGSRAVASSRLDKALGTNVIAEEVFASHQGEGGSVSAAVPGRPIIEGNDFGSMHINHDFARPETQKSLSDLQVNHFISGQLDAHGGNIFIDPATGKAKGIDNDGAFLPGQLPQVGPVMNMPQQIDLETGKKLLSMKAKNLGGVLNRDNPEEKQLTPDEIAAAQDRMRSLKAHVKDLKRNHQLIGQTAYGEDGQAVRDADGNKVKSEWGQETYNASAAAGKASRLEGGYVGRSVRERDPNRLQDNEYREEDIHQREENFALPFAAVSNINQAERQFDKYDAFGNAPDQRFIQDLPAPGPVTNQDERNGFGGGFNKDYSARLKAKGKAPAPPRDPAISQLMTSRMNDPVFAPNSPLPGADEGPARPRALSGAYGVPIPAPSFAEAPVLGVPGGGGPVPVAHPQDPSGPDVPLVGAPFLADAPVLGGPMGEAAPASGIAGRRRFFEELALGRQ